MTSEKKQLKIGFGAIQPSISLQLRQQGFEWDKRQIQDLEADSDAITRLYIRGLLTEGQARIMRQKLGKKIEKAITNW